MKWHANVGWDEGVRMYASVRKMDNGWLLVGVVVYNKIK